MITIDLQPGGAVELPMSRNVFCQTEFAPTKGCARNIESLLRRYLSDFRDETPSTTWPLTPYQQWAIKHIYREFESAHARTRLEEIEQYIINNREQLRKTAYERQRICQSPTVHEVAA